MTPGKGTLRSSWFRSLEVSVVRGLWSTNLIYDIYIYTYIYIHAYTHTRILMFIYILYIYDYIYIYIFIVYIYIAHYKFYMGS